MLSRLIAALLFAAALLAAPAAGAHPRPIPSAIKFKTAQLSMSGFGEGGFGAAAGGLMLDGITTGIKAAYSTRQLLTAYAGSPIRVQRISDNTQQDIGFSANVLNTSSLTTFCTGTTCKVVKWYDQSGNGLDQVQATIANAPIIYQSGAVTVINSQPAILFVQATPTTMTAASGSSNPTIVQYVDAVVSATLASGPCSIFAGNTGGAGGEFDFRVETTGKISILKGNQANLASSSGSITTNTGAIIETQYAQATGAMSFWINRSTSGTGTSTPPTWTAATPRVGQGASTGEYLNGLIGEMVVYDVAGGIPSGSQTSIENNQHTYWGTP